MPGEESELVLLVVRELWTQAIDGRGECLACAWSGRDSAAAVAPIRKLRRAWEGWGPGEEVKRGFLVGSCLEGARFPGLQRGGRGQLQMSVWFPQSGPEGNVWESLAQTLLKAHMQTSLLRGY